MSDTLAQFTALLNELHLTPLEYRPGTAREIRVSGSSPVNLKKFCDLLRERAGPKQFQFGAVFSLTYDESGFRNLLAEYKRVNSPEPTATQIPKEFESLKLYLDMTSKADTPQFFLATPENRLSEVGPTAYMRKLGIPVDEAIQNAQCVALKFDPRRGTELWQDKNASGELFTYFNTFVEPEWRRYEGELPDELPELYLRLIKHLIPLEIEKRYLAAWIYQSLEARSYVYLVLCGIPGSGKNRLRVVLEALHGVFNTTAGKTSNVTGQFNAQFFDKTLVWFDEYKYTIDSENVLKELQNDRASKEAKGENATSSSQIHASFVISNNKPRDNYIAMDARKFAPLQLAQRDLTTTMMTEEITFFTNKFDPQKPEYDVAFIAQIGRWYLKHGRDVENRFPNLEYKGPMHWRLAQTSMTRWQKKFITFYAQPEKPARVVAKLKREKGMLLFSSMLDAMSVSAHRSAKVDDMFPDYTTVKEFVDVYRDMDGRKIFKTKAVGDIMGDFWIKQIVDEIHVLKEVGDDSGDEDNAEKDNQASGDDDGLAEYL